jgi:hypothetical protein
MQKFGDEMSSAFQSLRQADGPQQTRSLAQHEIMDLARAGLIIFMTVVAALFVPRSLFATTPHVTPVTVAPAAQAADGVTRENTLIP